MNQCESVPESRHTSRSYQLGIAVLATVIVLIMVFSGLSSLTSGAAASATSVSAPVEHQILTASQLNSEKFLTNPASANGNGIPASAEGSAVSPSMPMILFISFDPANDAGLKALINAENTPGNSQYMKFPTGAQLLSSYGPDPSIATNAETYFTSQGLKVSDASSLGFLITGPASKVDTAFKTQVVTASYRGQAGYTNSLPLSLPASIASEVLSVAGFNSYAVAQPMSMVNPEYASLASTPAGSSFGSALTSIAGCTLTSNEACVANNDTGGFISYCVNQTSKTFGACTYGLEGGASPYQQFIYPTTPAHVLDAVSLQKNAHTDGSGTTIALIMGGGVNPGDLENYSQEVYGNACNLWCNTTTAKGAAWTTASETWTGRLNPVATFAGEGAGYPYYPVNSSYYSDDLSGEMALDMEYSSAMAPGATIMPVYGPGLNTVFLDLDYLILFDFFKAPSVISNSWGGSEDLWWNYGGPSWQSASFMDLMFQLETAAGATVMASSGDSGGYDSLNGILAASFPASDPYVLPVDGVTMTAQGPAGPFPTASTAPLGQLKVTLSPYGTTPSPTGYFPGITVNASTTTGLAATKYWYSNYSTTGPDYASGGIGYSQWFNQSWWSVGPGEVWTNHNSLAAVSAEADFNQTYYFDSGWNYFWGGTSFACPTVAGEFALADSLVYYETGSPWIGLGDRVVNQVATEYATGNLSLAPYISVGTGNPLTDQNFWDGILAQLGDTWGPVTPAPYSSAGTSPYYHGWNQTSAGFNQLTGYGLIDAAHFAADVGAMVHLGNTGATVTVGGANSWANLALGNTYAVTVKSGATNLAGNLHIWYWPNDAGTPLEASIPVVAGVATLPLLAAHLVSPGLIELNFTATGPAGFVGVDQILFGHVGPAALASLAITVKGLTSVMGGFSSPSEIWPLEPNTVPVQVTSAGHPVAGAVVTVTNVLWNDSFLPYTPYLNSTSFLGITNDTGYVLVDTWNVAQATTFDINVSVGSLTASTHILVTPQYNITTTNPLDQQSYVTGTQLGFPWEENEGSVGAIAVWDGELASFSVARTTVHDKTVAVTNAPLYTSTYNYGASGGNGSLLADNPSDYTSSGATGTGSMLIPYSIPVTTSAPYADYPTFAPTEFITAANTTYVNSTWAYNELYWGGGNYTTNLDNDVSGWPLIVGADPVSGTVYGDGPMGLTAGSATLASLSVSLPTFNLISGAPWNNQFEHVTSVQYQIDGGAGITVPHSSLFGNWNQTLSLPEVAIAGPISVGGHVLIWWVNDSLGHTFTDAIPFTVVVAGSGSVLPAVTFNAPTAGYDFTGAIDMPVNWTTTVSDSSEFANLAEIISITSPDGTITYTNGISAQTMLTVSATMGYTLTPADLALPSGFQDNLPAGGYVVTITVDYKLPDPLVTTGPLAGWMLVPTGVSNSQPFYHSEVSLSGPSPGTIFTPGNVTISYSYERPQATSVVLSVSQIGASTPIFTKSVISPNGTSAGSVSLVLTAGSYEANLTTENGAYHNWINASTTFTVKAVGSGIVYQNTTTPSSPFGVAPDTLGAILMVVGIIVGLLVGMIAASMMRRKPETTEPAKAWEPSTGGGSSTPPAGSSTTTPGAPGGPTSGPSTPASGPGAPPQM